MVGWRHVAGGAGVGSGVGSADCAGVASGLAAAAGEGVGVDAVGAADGEAPDVHAAAATTATRARAPSRRMTGRVPGSV